MFGTMNKTSGVKLLALVFAMAMVVVGAAVVLSDDSVNAAPTEDTNFTSGINDGTYEVSANTVVTLTNTIDTTDTGGDTLKIERAAGTTQNVTLTINMTVGGPTSTDGTTVTDKIMFDDIDLTVGEGVTLVLNLDSTTQLASDASCHIMVDGNLTVNKGATVEFSQSATAPGTTFWHAASANGTMDISGSVIFNNSNGINAKVVMQNTGSITVSGISSDAASFSFEADSMVKNGSTVNVNDADAFVSFIGDSTVNGNINSSEVRVYGGATVSVGATGKINADTIQYMNPAEGTQMGSIEITAGGSVTGTGEAATIEQALALLKTMDEVTISSPTALYLSDLSKDFIVPEGKTLNIVNTTIYDTAPTADEGVATTAVDMDIIVVTGTLVLDNSYIYCGVYVDEDVGGMVIANNVHNLTSTGIMYDSTRVGYGDTLTLSGTVPDGVVVNVYGTLVTTDLTINGVVNTYVGSTVNMTGTVTVSKYFTMNAGATMEINGTVNVRNDSTGGATFSLAAPTSITYAVGANQTSKTVSLDASVTVGENGSFNVTKPTSNAATGINSLNVASGSEFIVEGNLAITGTLSGLVQNKGTVTFNGTSNGGSILMYNDVSMTVTSVTGSLEIYDSEDTIYDFLGMDTAQATAAKYYLSAGNSITLEDVRNITIAESVTDKYDADTKSTYYVANMTVSGAASAVKTNGSGSIMIENACVDADSSEDGIAVGTMSIVDTFAVGSKITVITVGNIDVTGQVNIVAENAVFDNSNGTLTVSGTVTVGPDATNGFTEGAFNAVRYTVTDSTDSTVTVYYTSFAAAIDAVANATDMTVTILGTVAVSADDEVPVGATVAVSGTLNIDMGVTLTVNDGAFLNNAGSIYVNGTLVINNYNTGLSGNMNGLHYDVYTFVDPVATYTSLANALANAQPGQTITLSQDVDLKNSITIPADVTVQTGRNTVTVFNGVTITVNGTLAIQNGGSVILDSEDADLGWNDGARIVVGGVVSNANSGVDMTGYAISGAYYTSRGVNYVTSVAYAAENVTQGEIIIRGQVNAGDVAFTAENNRTLDVEIIEFDAKITDAPDTIVTAGTITVADGVSITMTSGEFTGTIAGPADGGNASAQFNAASGVEIVSDTDAAGTTAYLYINGTVAGDMTVSAGTVTVGGTTSTLDTTSDTDARGIITVASGATLVIPDSATITANKNSVNGATVVVSGTINVIGTFTVSTNAEASVNGTVTVAKVDNAGAAAINVEGTLNVTGTVTAETDNSTGFVIDGTLVVGSKPTVLGTESTGIVSGPATSINNIKVYDGASVDGLVLNGTAINDVTSIYSVEYYINDTLYMTYFTSTATMKAVGANSPIAGDVVSSTVGLQLSGLNTTDINNVNKWFTDSEGTFPITNNNQVSQVDAVYFDAPAATLTGTVSAGTGLVIYIDNVAQESGNDIKISYGNHVVTIDVKVGYDASNAVITFNGQTIQSGDTITVTEDGFTLTASGAVPMDYQGGSTSGGDDGLGLTDYLLIILVVLIVIMAIMVAMRLMRS